jgi:LacI family transcriptional regulator
LRDQGVTQLRFEGYRRALEESNIPYRKELVFPGVVSFQSGMESAERVLSQKSDVTAMFCTADILAIGALKKALEMGRRIPDDLSIMGFDNLNISEYSSPSITTVGQDIELKGKLAVEIILDDINNQQTEPRCIVLPLEIVERQSTRRI